MNINGSINVEKKQNLLVTEGNIWAYVIQANEKSFAWKFLFLIKNSNTVDLNVNYKKDCYLLER